MCNILSYLSDKYENRYITPVKILSHLKKCRFWAVRTRMLEKEFIIGESATQAYLRNYPGICNFI